MYPSPSLPTPGGDISRDPLPAQHSPTVCRQDSRHLSGRDDGLSIAGCLWNPSHSPSMPPGRGTGHSRFDDDFLLAALISSPWPGRNSTMRSSVMASPSGFLRRRRRAFGSGISPSAYTRRGAGHGSRWGSATTRKLARTVVANSDEVIRDLGWRWGGAMIERGRESGRMEALRDNQ